MTQTKSEDWDEIRYLYDKILHWFYGKGDRRKSLPLCCRLKTLLGKASPGREAIFAEECRSLIHEVEGDYVRAIAYRKHEIELIRKLRRISLKKPYEEFVLAGYGAADLSDRYDLLAILYHDAGNLGQAIRTLQHSRRLCQKYGVPFDGAGLLEEFQVESDQQTTNGKGRKRGN